MGTYVVKATSPKYSDKEIENYLRSYETPIIVRVYNGEVMIDVRTLQKDDYNVIASAFKSMGEE